MKSKVKVGGKLSSDFEMVQKLKHSCHYYHTFNLALEKVMHSLHCRWNYIKQTDLDHFRLAMNHHSTTGEFGRKLLTIITLRRKQYVGRQRTNWKKGACYIWYPLQPMEILSKKRHTENPSHGMQ